MELAIYAHRMWYQTSVCDFLTDALCYRISLQNFHTTTTTQQTVTGYETRNLAYLVL